MLHVLREQHTKRSLLEIRIPTYASSLCDFLIEKTSMSFPQGGCRNERKIEL